MFYGSKDKKALQTIQNARKIAKPHYYDGVPEDFGFFPFCTRYYYLFKFPKDIQPDWRDGIREAEELVKKYGIKKPNRP